MNDEDLSPPRDNTLKGGDRNPPKSTRFQKGASGNPRGRPRGTRSIGKMLNDALMKKVRVKENGRERGVTMLEVIIGRLVMDSAKGLTASTRLLVALLERYSGASDTAIDVDALAAEDRVILENYFAEQQRSSG